MYKFIATALPDLPVAKKIIQDVITDEATIDIIPLPFLSLKQLPVLPTWYNDLVEADAILVRSGIIDHWLIDRLKNCRVIALHGVGVDQVDVDYCTQKGIAVTNVPGGNATAAAELTIGLMIDSLRHISRADCYMKNMEWDSGRTIGNELGSQKVGIIGLGSIGRKVANICEAFGSQVAYYDYKETPDLPSSFRFMDLYDLLEWSDIVSIHVPLTESTRGLIGEKELKLIGKNGMLINAARGAIVDEKALINALENGQIKWVACDVFKHEPPNFHSKLFKYANTTFTPHIGGSTIECLEIIAQKAALDMLRVLQGKKPFHLVNEVSL